MPWGEPEKEAGVNTWAAMKTAILLVVIALELVALFKLEWTR